MDAERPRRGRDPVDAAIADGQLRDFASAFAAIGARQARRWFATAGHFDADTAARIGLLHEVVEEDQLDVAADYSNPDGNLSFARLEQKIDELKSFERDYRLKLRGYIESQLRDLDRSSSLAFGGQGGS